MPKYNIGDIVVVRNDLRGDRIYYMRDGVQSLCGKRAVSEMFDLAGKTVTISHAEHSYYCVEESSWHWADEMFSGLECEVGISADFAQSDMSLEELLGVNIKTST